MKTWMLAIVLVSTAAAGTSIQNPEPGQIAGVVLDGTTSEPVEGAQVSVGGSSILTGTDGRFVIPTIAPGTLQLRVQKAGYLPIRPEGRKLSEMQFSPLGLPVVASRDPYSLASAGRGAASNPGIPVSVSVGERPNLTIRVIPAPVISGRILDDRGEPVPGVSVFPFRYTYDDWGERVVTEDSRGSVTDDRGEYRINYLYPGEYGLRVAPPSLRLGEIRAKYYVSTYYPGTTDITKAEMVRVAAGEQTKAGIITVVFSRGGVLRARLPASAPGSPGPMISVRRKGETGAMRSGPAALGSTEVEIGELPPGAYELQADIGAATSRTRVITTIFMGADDVQVVLEPVKPAVLTARAVMEPRADSSAQPVPGIQLQVSPAIIGQLGIFPRSGANGEISLPPNAGIAPGFYRVSAGGIPATMYLAAIRSGGDDILNRQVDVRSGDILSIDIILGEPAGVVQGHAIDDRGRTVPGAIVVLIPDDRSQRHLFIARAADDRGAFQLQNAPGAYHLYAWTELDGAAYRNAEFMSPLKMKGTAVRLEKAAKLDFDLKVLE